MKQLTYALRNEWYNILLLLIPFVTMLFIWGDVPSQMATRWNFEGEPNGYSNRTIGLLLIPSLNVVLYVILLYLPVIDPKKRIEVDQKPMPTIRTVMVIFFTGFYALIITKALGIQITIQSWIFPGFALFFIIIGNYLRTIKPNYFIGIRVPWTLEDADNWRKTHKLGSIIWVVGGLVLLLLYPLIDLEIYNTLFFLIVIMLAIVPMGYSFYLYKFTPE